MLFVRSPHFSINPDIVMDHDSIMKSRYPKGFLDLPILGKNRSFHQNIIELPFARLTGGIYTGWVLTIYGSAHTVCKSRILVTIDYLHFIA
jgi:hypothetical protein